MIVRIMFLIVLCAGVAAFAHQDEPVSEAFGFDCEHPPEGAVKSLPGLLGEAGRLVCMQSGQRIVASQAWSWRYSGSFLSTPNVPAHAHIAARGMQPPFYFRKVSAEVLPAADANKRSEELSKKIVTYRPDTALVGMTIVKAENNYGHVTEIFMPMLSETSGWAIVCAPECEPGYVILISKREPN
jgi:hypothetical protein